MGTLFWIFALLGCAALVAVWFLTLEGEHNRQRKLRKIQKRLEQIEAQKKAKSDDAGDNA